MKAEETKKQGNLQERIEEEKQNRRDNKNFRNGGLVGAFIVGIFVWGFHEVEKVFRRRG